MNKPLSPEQEKAIYEIEKNLFGQIMLQGGGGTGKTRTTVELIRRAAENYVVTATTGAAARVLKNEFDELGVEVEKISTLHSALQFLPKHDITTKNHRKLVEYEPSVKARDFKVLKGKVLVIDEASMLCEEMYEYIIDLIDYSNLKAVLPIGDFYQLKCVGDKTFNFDGLVVELTEIFRSAGKLMEYQKQLREEIDDNQKPLSLYEDAILFTDEKEFISFVNKYEGSKTVVAHTHKRVDAFVEQLDSVTVYPGQEVRVSGACKYAHKSGGNDFQVKNNSVCKVIEIYDNIDEMRDAADEFEYGCWLPNVARFSPEIQDRNMTFAKIITDEQQTGFISIWNGLVSNKEKIIAKKVNGKVRKFLEKVLKKRKLVNANVKLNITLFRTLEDKLKHAKAAPLSDDEKRKKSTLWTEFFVFTNALSLRSIVASTIHKSQGLNVDLIAVDWRHIKNKSVDLQYVAFTRAKKDIAVLL